MKITKILIIINCIFKVICDDFSSDEYIKLTAIQKMNKLWDILSYNQTSSQLSSFDPKTTGLTYLFDLKPTYETKGDALPEGREKLASKVGVVAKVNWISTNNHPYTGIFQGSTSGLIRFSILFKPIKISNPPQDFAPAFGIKFLRDGVDSGNVLAMYLPTGQPSWNPFAYDFTNYFELSKAKISFLVFAVKFVKYTKYISGIGVRDMAEFGQDGKKENNPRYPFKLIFRPTVEVSKIFPDTYTEEFTDQLIKISADTPLYDVYALDEPKCKEIKIAVIKTKTNFIKSSWGDSKLFFKHNDIKNDDVGNNWSSFRDSFSIITGLNSAPVPEKSFCPFLKLLR